MSNDLWLNLPVKDLKKSRAFFAHLGFKFHPRHDENDKTAAALVFGDGKIIVMLFPEETFTHFTRHPLANPRVASEILISIDAGSKKEVDELARKVQEAGGSIFGDPVANDGWMYGFGFADLDGHRWNSLYMDMAKMPKKAEGK